LLGATLSLSKGRRVAARLERLIRPEPSRKVQMKLVNVGGEDAARADRLGKRDVKDA